MSRKPAPDRRAASGPAKADARRAPTLASLRADIDRIDKELVELLNRRAQVALAIGQIKEAEGIEVWSQSREEEVIARALAQSQGPLPPETVRLIFRELMSGSRAIQRTLRVASLGPKYSYSHMAAVVRFGKSAEHVPVGSIAAVFEEVNRGHVQFGLVPLENSIDGRVTDTLEMFIRLPSIKIRGEVKLRIHHCLMARCAWGQVQRVYSKAQALSQCRHWLGKNLPQARTIEVISTAAAAEHAAREEFAAAIASRPAADAYGLKVLAANIEDQPHNVTRFAVIAEQSERRSGKDKTTLLMRLPNQAGSLVKALALFEKGGLNLTFIESFPVPDATPDRDPSYLFFVDVEGHIEDEAVKRVVESVRKKCERLDVLGSYPRSDCIEN
jgi:chorismate mutase/prephenate dehydratase